MTEVGSSSEGTSSGVTAANAGRPSLAPTASNPVITSQSAGLALPPDVTIPSTPATASWIACVTMISRRRSDTSAMAPAGSASAKLGNASAVDRSATSIVDAVSEVINHAAATRCIQVPSSRRATRSGSRERAATAVAQMRPQGDPSLARSQNQRNSHVTRGVRACGRLVFPRRRRVQGPRLIGEVADCVGVVRFSGMSCVCVTACALGLLLGPAPATADVPLHTGSTALVRLVKFRGGQLTARLTARGHQQLARRLKGNVLDGSCTTLGATVQGSTLSSESSSESAGIDSRGHVSYEFAFDPRADFCDISLSKLTVRRSKHGASVSASPVPGPPIDTIALTRKGVRYLDEDRITAHVFVVLQLALALAHADPAGRFPPASAVVAAFARARLPWKVAALSHPSDMPQGSTVGVFSDAANRAEAVGVTASGQRLFIDSDNGVLSSNSYQHLTRYLTGQVAPTISS